MLTNEHLLEPESLGLLFRKISDLKRQPSAYWADSFAESLFLQTFRAVLNPLVQNRMEQLNCAVDCLILAGLSGMVLGELGEEILHVLPNELEKPLLSKLLDFSFGLMPASVSKSYRAQLNPYIQEPHTLRTFRVTLNSTPSSSLYKHVEALCDHTRAGYAHPQRGKLNISPRESQADHCLCCALYANVLSHINHVDSYRSTLMALFHHLPMAIAPDIDHEAEVIIGPDLKYTIEQIALKEILRFESPRVRGWVESLLQDYAKGKSPESRIVREADIIDRAIQLRYYADLTKLSFESVVEEYSFFNEGALGKWQTEILNRYNLI